MWATSVTKTIEKKTKTTLPLEKYLNIARENFIEQRKEVPVLLEKANALEVKANALNKRYELRQKKDLETHVKNIRRECEERMSMQRENEYEQTIAPYLSAYNQRVEITGASDNAPRNITAPGTGKKRETIDTYVQQYDATASRQNTIVNE